MNSGSSPPDGGVRFARFSWILLDWAASGFSTAVITLVVTYVEKVVFPQGGWGVAAGVIWAWTLAAAMLGTALIAPWAAAWADRRDAHQRALVIATLGGVGGLLLLAAVPPAARLAVVAATVVACIGFDMTQVFSGSLLPRIAADDDADRLSAYGFAAGYGGGAIALLLATALVAAHDRCGLDVAGGLRLAFTVVAAWWLVFSVPAAIAIFGSGNGGRHAPTPAAELLAFARSLWSTSSDQATRAFAGVLGGAMLALGAVQTAIAQFTSLALQRFDLDGPALVRLVLLVQVVALPGALIIGWLSVHRGRRLATASCLAGWAAVLVLGWFVQTPAQLTWLAVLLALVLGGLQSVLRAAVAALTPPSHAGVTFGLMQVGTKLAGFTASLVFGALQAVTGEPRAGLVALLLQLGAATFCLARLTDRGAPDE